VFSVVPADGGEIRGVREQKTFVRQLQAKSVASLKANSNTNHPDDEFPVWNTGRNMNWVYGGRLY
jgi:hypothetical protein